MKNVIFLLAMTAAGYFGYQKYFSDNMYGQWQLDIEAMQKQLVNAGMPQPAIDSFKTEMTKGRTTTIISKKSIAFTINGQHIDFPYEVIGSNGKCKSIRAQNKILDYCVNGDALEVHNQGNSMFEVYKRI